MDGYGRKMLRLVFCAFCLMTLAVFRVNSNFNTIVQPPTTIEILEMEGLMSSTPNLTLVGQRLELPDLRNLGNLKTELIRKGELAREQALVWWDQVREGQWENIASKKREKGQN